MQVISLNLTQDSIKRLTAKFHEFKKLRDDLNIFLVSYISDYMRLKDNDSKRRIYLRKKYGLNNPRINYEFNSGNNFCWSVRNIAKVLGRDRTSILRVLSKMNESESWYKKLTSLHSVINCFEGGKLDVYAQDIFDVIIDYYEDEYLQRFSQPRHGNYATAPSIEELRKFWASLHGREAIQKRVFLPTGGGGAFKKKIGSMIWIIRKKIQLCVKFLTGSKV